MKNQIIFEQAMPSKINIIEESTIPGSSNKIIFRAVLQEANHINNNKRIYPLETLQEVVNQLAPKAAARKLMGELDHPQPQGDTAAKMKRSSTILLQNVCVLFRKIELVGTQIVAECETLNTPSGEILYTLLKDNATIGFSLRAFGDTKSLSNGVVEVVPDGLKALTFDVVANPSHDNAVIIDFLEEGFSYKEALKLVEEMTEYKKALENTKEPKLMEEACNLFNSISKDNNEQVCINGICMREPLEEAIDYVFSLSTKEAKNKFKQVRINI